MKDINRYYSPDKLYDRILQGLERLGRSVETATLDDLQAVDEFHIRGTAATLELIDVAEFNENMHVLDIGCGVGGSSRRLAAEAECRVTGVDLSEEYIDVATRLTKLLGMQDKVSFQVGDALNLPFDDSSFDGAWAIQVNMNIENKREWLDEIYRVLRPNGKVVLYEVCAGKTDPQYFPVPWAQDASMSYLVSPDTLQQLVVDAGFDIDEWQDRTEEAVRAFSHMKLPSEDAELPPLGVHLLVGDDILTKAYNLHRNFDQERVTLVQTIACKPAS